MAESEASGPARDLWIEIERVQSLRDSLLSGPARDLWIEMTDELVKQCRVPQGTCGLKF